MKSYLNAWFSVQVYSNNSNLTLSRGKEYATKTSTGIMVNWIGLLILLFGILVVYLAANPRYKRLTRPEDEMLLTETVNE